MRRRPLDFPEPEGFTARERRSSVSESFSIGNPQLADLWGSLSATASGVNVTPDNARRCPEVDACVSLIEDTIATLPLELYERVSPNEQALRDDNPLHALLHDAPNDWQTSADFRQMMEGWRSTHGNAYAKITWGGGAPRELQPLHPLTTWPFRTAAGAVAYHYTPLNGPAEVLMQDEVLHLRDAPARIWNLLMGESKVERHRETIGRVMATSEYMARFFSNNATPKHALVVPRTLSDEAFNALEERWSRRHGGLQNAHRLAFLEGGMDLKAIGVSNDDAQLIESYGLGVQQLARIWDTPLHLIGETDKTTSWGTGIEQQSIGFISYFMRPKFVVWEQALNRTLMSAQMRQRFFFRFDIDGLLRGDFKTRMEGYGLLIQWGICTPNEVRKREGMAPLDDPYADQRMAPLNMVPATLIAQVLVKDAEAGGESGGSQREQLDRLTRALTDAITAARAPMRIAA